MKAIALALLATLIATLGQLLLKSGMRQVGPISGESAWVSFLWGGQGNGIANLNNLTSVV